MEAKQEPAKLGRGSKYTEDRVKRILDSLRDGCTQKASAANGGISEETFSDWRDKKPEFAEAVLEAVAECETKNLRIVKQAAKPRRISTIRTKTTKDKDGNITSVTTTRTVKVEHDWQAAAWILERRFSKDYGRKVDLTTGNAPMKALVGVEIEDV